MSPPIVRLRARWVLPTAHSLIEDGEVVVEGERIADVRPRPAGAVGGDAIREFPDAVLLPGLVNAHTHLDYTVMRGLLDDDAFFPWVRALVGLSEALIPADWEVSALVGAMDAAAGGATTVADCSPHGAAARALSAVGLRGLVYQEVFGIGAEPVVSEALDALAARLRSLQTATAGGRIRLGVSPHALYTVRPDLLRAVCAWARDEGLPVCIHAAESRAEEELVRHGSGPIAESLARRGIDWRPSGASPLQHLLRHGALAPGTLLVHGVRVDNGDARRVAEAGCAWVHCPKSNAKLANGVARLATLRGPHGDVPVGLGSDSVVSNNAMDMFEEMRFAVLAQRAMTMDPHALTAKEVLEMATLGGARALGMAQEIGSLEAGKQADIVAVRLDRAHAWPVHDPQSAVVYTARGSDVAATFVAGEPVVERGRALRPNRRRIGRRARAAAERVRQAARTAAALDREERPCA